ncbi:hypothetical protein chiPu_0000214 [Chiloscyllium punctatum]|uniref:Uncharacterized protein n=1 Tax=Chiloscyllium punctatum TaxID=137246 RepID=A0A401RUK1_CHIPU|nr:hypothetical protein [Chiloscyllium punctatum]
MIAEVTGKADGVAAHLPEDEKGQDPELTQDDARRFQESKETAINLKARIREFELQQVFKEERIKELTHQLSQYMKRENVFPILVHHLQKVFTSKVCTILLLEENKMERCVIVSLGSFNAAVYSWTIETANLP